MREKLLSAALASLLAVPALAGEIKGTVNFKGQPPDLPPLKVTKDQNHCGQTVPNQTVVVKDHHLANVVITIQGSGLPKPAAQKVTVDQQGCQYRPHVQGAAVGSTLEIVNSDPMLHNIHGREGQLTVFNVAMPIKGMKVPKPLSKEGIVHLKCDVHNWMEGYVVVTNQPYAVDGEDGTYSIKDIPPGTYTVDAWHEKFGHKTQQVTVPASGAATVDFTFGG